MPKSVVTNRQQQEDVEAVEDTDEITIHKPYAKSPFKAIRGEGNSFHGWCM